MLYLSVPARMEIKFFGNDPSLCAFLLGGRLLGAKWVKEMTDEQRAVVHAAIESAGEEGNLPRPFDGAVDYDDETWDEMDDHLAHEAQVSGEELDWEERNKE